MHWKYLVVSASGSHAVANVLRLFCSQLVTDRLDPLVNPDVEGSQHVHQIVGGDAFAPLMNFVDFSARSSCTSCMFQENFSNYWTQVMYFRARNNTFKRVPQVAKGPYGGANGGMQVYYTVPDDPAVKVTAFAPGFRMLIGDPTARSFSGSITTIYRCFAGPEPDYTFATSFDFPKKPCPGGLRVETVFPNCWDGVNLDTPDHNSHVVFAVDDNGTCTTSHPVAIPQLTVESIWDTAAFPESEWPADGTQPFVWSQGDASGYGAHADYMFGWEGDSLQRAIDARCDYPATCSSELTIQDYATANVCEKGKVVVEPEGVDECECPW